MKKKVFLWIIGISLATVALVTIITTQIRINDKKEELRELEAKRDVLLKENERLEHDLAIDVTDDYIVQMMRKLGYRFPGETQVIFGEDDKSEAEN